MKIDNKPLLLIVCGTGGKKYHNEICFENMEKDTCDLECCSNNLGYGHIKINEDKLCVEFLDDNNKSEYICYINKNIQEYTSRIQKDVHVMQTAVKNNEKDLAKYQAEIASYQAEVAKETQEQNLKVQQYQGLYAQLKAEYDGAYAIMAPKQRKGD